MEIISSKQEKKFKSTNAKVLIQGFVWSFEILITNRFSLNLFFLIWIYNFRVNTF